MGKLDDLHTLVKLLNAFELPVSPILEYAIKEKEEELIQAGHTEEFKSSDTSDILEYHEVERNTYFSDFTPSRTRSNTETLRVEYPDGKVIQYPRASDTYIEVIKTCNPSFIHELNIVHAGINIVSKEYDDKYAKAQHEIGDGWLVFTNTPTRKKKDDLIRISEELGLGLRVEVVMKGSNEIVVEESISDSTRQKLRVVFPDGRVLQPNRVYEAVVEVVKFAGAEDVRNLGIIVCGDNLVLKQPRSRYVKACKPIGNGWLVNTCSSTPVKYAQIKHISDRLNLGITVDIIGGNGDAYICQEDDNIDSLESDSTIEELLPTVEGVENDGCQDSPQETSSSLQTSRDEQLEDVIIDNPDDITLELISQMVEWDKIHHVLDAWKQKGMRDVVCGRREFTSSLRYAFYLNLRTLRKKGFPN